MSQPAPAHPRHRECIVLRGSAMETQAQALTLLGAIAGPSISWIGDPPPDAGDMVVIPPGRVATLLGRAFDVVVLDGHAGIDPDALGAAHGLVWGGGALVLRLPELGTPPADTGQAPLAAYPHTPADVGRRFAAHLERALARTVLTAPHALQPATHAVAGTPEQAVVVERLVSAWSSAEASRVAVLADRGRGKSSAMGLALNRMRADHRPHSIAVTGPHPDAVTQVLRFANGHSDAHDGRISFVPLSRLVFEPQPHDVIVVDEAAQLPVPMLRRLVQLHPAAHLAWATTTHGYEGTGRGFSLRFLAGLERGPIAVQRLELTTPIRWDAGDPLERLVFDALLLDARPAAIEAPAPSVAITSPPLEAVQLQRDALLADETQLRELFGLLVHAHYRTTPGDLRRILDAPNLCVHALRWQQRIVAATLVAREGGLPAPMCDAMAHGRTRIRAHALPDALVAHLGRAAAGSLRMLRSVRIAVHADYRRRGLATRLVEHVHQVHTPDLFGTLFGATAELLAFRRSLGYSTVRISASRGARTGEPSVMMVRPVSADAHQLVTELRAELARDLGVQLELMQADGETLLEPELFAALHRGLPSPAALSDEVAEALTASYASGPRTFESVALAVAHYVQAHPGCLHALDDSARRLVEGRVLQRGGWRTATQHAGLPSVPAAMRALRRAVRRLVELSGAPDRLGDDRG